MLDPVPGNICSWVLLRQEIQILLRNCELAVGRCDVSVFNVLCVQRLEFPVVVLLLFGILEVGNFSEYRDLLDELLQ